MNKIEEMIKQLCPNGVECKKLGEVANFKYGYTGTANDNGQARYIRITDINSNGLLNSNDAKYIDITDENKEYLLKKGDIIMARTGATFGKTLYYTAECPSIYASFLIKIGLPSNICPRFYWHFSQSDSYWNQALKYVGGGAQPQFNTNAISQVSIPLPPLPIQTEIVRILDKFVEQQEQLERLIELRKKQYEYYREEMLKPKEGEVWETKRLGEIGTFVRGNGLQKTDFREEGFPCIHYGQVHTYYGFSATETKSFCSETLAEKLKKASYGDLIIATTSEDVDACCKATVWLGKGKVAISGDSYLFSHNKNPKFVAHLFRTKRFADQKRMVATGAKVVRVSGESMAKFEFQIPSSLDRQKEIADALDRFELSLSSLISALEATKARYEYYRDLMLNF
ncbi:MAG: restriction endonuclease subunit S [Paludibacteraceae bacterium]|nr:restriction endonuclease subunit S [Paludibacteraceae bacterium]